MESSNVAIPSVDAIVHEFALRSTFFYYFRPGTRLRISGLRWMDADSAAGQEEECMIGRLVPLCVVLSMSIYGAMI